MPWWSWLWVAVMLVVTAGGVRLDARDREPWWYTIAGLASGIASVVFVVNHFGVVRLGSLAIPAVIALAFLVYESWRDVSTMHDLTAAEKSLAFMLTLVLFAPANILGVLGAAA